MNPRPIIATASLLSVAIVLAASWWWLVPAQRGAAAGFLLNADQQARRLLDAGDPPGAAGRFRDPLWQATARYRAGDFKEAAGTWAGLEGADSAYNQGTALIMAGKYEDAIKRFDAALALRPDWQEAQVSREIALHRAERVKREGGDMTGGKLGADDIVFDKGKPPGQGDSDQQEQADGAPSEAELRAIWMRRVQTNPGDFLRAKFAYQRATAEDKP